MVNKKTSVTKKTKRTTSNKMNDKQRHMTSGFLFGLSVGFLLVAVVVFVIIMCWQ